LPSAVDYSSFLPFVRHQGGYGCGMFAHVACWDIMNERRQSFAPNLSVNRQIWAWARIINGKTIPGFNGKQYSNVMDYLIEVGSPTEGSELTDTDGIRWPTTEGDYETSNYKAKYRPSKKHSTAISVDVNEFKKWLNIGPFRVSIWNNHFVALVGYNDTTQRFKFINSWGERWGENGFGYVNYSNLNNEIQGAEYYEFEVPKPVPVARISLKHTYRQDVYLWLGIEGITYGKRIWPCGQRHDDSRDLNFTVTLPRGFIWPPSENNRLYLELFDSGEHSNSGGDILEFTASFSGQTFTHGATTRTVGGVTVHRAPPVIHFEPHQVKRLYIPET
jgi:hypothetical protein